MMRMIRVGVMAAAVLGTGSVWAGSVGAGDLTVTDAYARSATATAKSGAAFLVIENTTGADDRLVGVSSPAAALAELHTHQDNGAGVMRMVHVEEGLELPDGGKIEMKRGGAHVMLMGLTVPFEQGATIPVTLIFEKAGEKTVEVPVDLTR